MPQHGRGRRNRTSNSPQRKRQLNSQQRRRLRFEPLEDRRLLSITVDTLVDENDGVGVGTGTSLREAIAAAAPGDTIDFAVTGTINLSYGASNSTKQLTIDKNLTIQGPGADLLTINAFDPTPTQKNGDGSQAFLINDAIATNVSDVTIKGLTITGGDATSAGGAIQTYENLTLADSVISGNRSAGGGGGVYSYTHTHTTLPNSLTITNCLFDSNISAGEGGAVRKRYGTLVMTDCIITNNTAVYAGGVSASDHIVAQIQNCDISQNHATSTGIGGGGAIVTVNGSLSVTGSTIRNNTSIGKGAGIYSVDNTLISLQNTTVSGNTTTNDGGGIYLNLVTDLELSDCVLTSNGAARGAGIAGTPQLLNITRTTFAMNQATSSGGGIYVTPTLGTVNINGGAFLGNKAANGGGIWASAALTVNDCEISGNTATTSGGGIYISPAARSSGLQLNRSILRNNSAKNGGGVYSAYKTTITGSKLESNHAVGGAGGAIYGASFTVDQSQIGDNTATTNGGGIAAAAIAGGAASIVKNSTISGNSAGSGGGVSIFNNNSGITITDSTVSGNNATVTGGGIYTNSPTSIARSTITANSAPDGKGSGLAAVNSPLSTTVQSTIVAGNLHSDIDYAGVSTNPIHSTGYNLIGTGTTAPFNQPGDQIGILNPMLGPLADNGGHTKTHALLAGSPALNAGDPAAVAGVSGIPLYDQRGNPITRVADGRVDIGAFESQAIPPAFMGDYNVDGIVNSLDYIVWRAAQGTTGLTRYTGADGTGDGVVGLDDYTLWRSHFGSVVPQGIPVVATGDSLNDGNNVATMATVEEVKTNPLTATPRKPIMPPSVAPAIEHKQTTPRPIKTFSGSLLTAIWRDEVLAGWKSRIDDSTTSLHFDANDSASGSYESCHPAQAIDIALNAWSSPFARAAL